MLFTNDPPRDRLILVSEWRFQRVQKAATQLMAVLPSDAPAWITQAKEELASTLQDLVAPLAEGHTEEHHDEKGHHIA